MYHFSLRYRQRIFAASCCCLLLAGGFLSGCSSPTETPNQQPPVQSEGTQMNPAKPADRDLIAGEDSRQALVGTWLGEAVLDRAALDAKLETLPAGEQAEVRQLAADFLTTVMAIDLRADGSIEKEIELTPADGRPLRDGGQGNWRVVQTSGDRVLVEMNLSLVDGTSLTTQEWFRLDSSGDSLTTAVPLGDALTACNPQIVLYRQRLSAVNLAEQTDGGVVR